MSKHTTKNFCIVGRVGRLPAEVCGGWCRRSLKHLLPFSGMLTFVNSPCSRQKRPCMVQSTQATLEPQQRCPRGSWELSSLKARRRESHSFRTSTESLGSHRGSRANRLFRITSKKILSCPVECVSAPSTACRPLPGWERASQTACVVLHFILCVCGGVWVCVRACAAQCKSPAVSFTSCTKLHKHEEGARV